MNLSKAHLDFFSSYNSCLFAVMIFIDQKWVVEVFVSAFADVKLTVWKNF